MNGVEAVASWFTPTVLFCFVNLMIGTIFIAATIKGEQPPPPQLVRVPSFFERVRSFNLSRNQTQPPESANHAVDPAEEEEVAPHGPHHVPRSKSAAVAKVAPAAKVLQKSASEKVSTEKEDEDEEWRRPATMRERTAREDEEVDEKADDFINRFRQQLRLQRLNSLLRGGREVSGAHSFLT